MPSPNQEVIDLIATQILFDAKTALINLQKFNASVTSSAEKVTVLKNIIRATAAQMNGDLKGATASVQKFANSFTGINPQLVSSAGRELQKTGETGAQAGKQIEGGFKKAVTSINIMRIALGALISMILFQALQAVSTFFTSAIKQATQFEDTLYRLQNAEKALSMEGVEVTLKGLKQGIADIQKLLPIFSKEDVSQLVGTLAVSTKQLKLNEQQVLDLAKAIGILNIRSEKQEDLSTTAQHVLSSLLTGNAKGISALGIAFTDNVMRAKAMELGFLEAGDALSTLSENEKGITKLNIVLDSTGQELGAVGDYLESNSAKLQQNKAAWNDLLTVVGQIILPFIPAVTELFEGIRDGLNAGKVFLIEFLTLWGAAGVIIKQVLSGNIKSLDDFNNTLKQSVDILRTDLVNTFFKDVPENAPDWFMRGWGDKIKEDAETATNAIDDMYDSAADSEEAQKALEDLDQKIQDIILDAQQAQEDLDLKLEQKQDDLDLEYLRKEEDAAADHADKLEDINQDALDKIEDAKRKAREEEKKAEQDLLQKLKELRQRFLMDLEDALHARDARQVLRLIREYKFDKQNILDKKKLDDQQRKDSLAADLAAIETERKRRIESENIEYQRKLADLNEAKAREQADLQLWYKREQEDIQRNIQQKIEALIAGYIAEGKIHEDNQAAIYATLVKYFGKDTALVNSLANFMAERFAQMNAMAAQTSANLAAAFGGSVNMSGYSLGGGLGASGLGTSSGGTSGKKGKEFAEGGTIIASKPTRAIFGEAGLEAATFTPLGRTGKDVNKVFGDVSGIGGASGMAKVLLTLSPDLRGEILSDAMDGVAVVIEHVRRERTG